ncbi:MAG: class I SAM-dependent methyltransferase [Sneathiella sp.]
MRKADGKDRSPVLGALAIQAVVFGALYLLRPLVEEATGTAIPPLWVMLAQGIIAGIVSRGFRFSLPWVVGQVIAPPLLLFALALDLPGWVFPVILLLLVLVFWNVAGNRVPLFLTNRTTAAALLELLPYKTNLHTADLGSGLGGTLRFLARARPEMQFTGLETAPLPFAISWLRGKLSGAGNLDFRFRDIFRENLGKYDVVYCFLSPVPMTRLYDKARAEMKPGSLFISNSFTVPDHPPDATIAVDDRRRTQLLIWRM